MPIDYRNYPKDWKHRRRRILARAANRCEHCDVRNYSVIQRFDGAEYRTLKWCDSFQEAREQKMAHIAMAPTPIIVVLTLAHLDHDEWNHDVEDSRLAALCQRCHFHYDLADNKKRKLYGRQYARHQLCIDY